MRVAAVVSIGVEVDGNLQICVGVTTTVASRSYCCAYVLRRPGSTDLSACMKTAFVVAYFFVIFSVIIDVAAVFQVPMALEALVKGPWDPQGDVWRRQLDLAAQVGVCYH